MINLQGVFTSMYRITEIANKLNVSRQTIHKKVKLLEADLEPFMIVKNDVKYYTDEAVELIKDTITFTSPKENDTISDNDNSQTIDINEYIKLQNNYIASLQSEIDTKNKQLETKDKLLENMQVLLKQEQQGLQENSKLIKYIEEYRVKECKDNNKRWIDILFRRNGNS
jgi:predicted DNA-binding protein YlxM (UPF0122 family)